VLESGDFSDAELVSRDGLCKVRVHRAVLAHRSDWFRAAFNHARSAGTSHSVDIASDLLVDLVRYLYTVHDAEMVKLFDPPDKAVAVAMAADQLLLPPLRDRAVNLLLECVDDANVCSLLGTARLLSHEGLYRTCVAHIAKNLVSVSQSPFFSEMVSPAMKRLLERLQAASRCNPLHANADLHDAREFLGMLRESLEEQQYRFSDAVERQREVEAQLRAQGVRIDDPRWIRVTGVWHTLNAKEKHIEKFKAFIAKQEQLFRGSEEDESPSAQGTAAAPPAPLGQEPDHGEFTPTYEWREVPPEQTIPSGLEVKLALRSTNDVHTSDAGVAHELQPPASSGRKARIPPVWRLKLWVESASGYYRHDIQATTLVGDVLDGLHRDLGKPPGWFSILLPGSGPQTRAASLPDAATGRCSATASGIVDPARSFGPDLFLAREQLRIVLSTDYPQEV